MNTTMHLALTTSNARDGTAVVRGAALLQELCCATGLRRACSESVVLKCWSPVASQAASSGPKGCISDVLADSLGRKARDLTIRKSA